MLSVLSKIILENTRYSGSANRGWKLMVGIMMEKYLLVKKVQILDVNGEKKKMMMKET